MPTYYAAHKAEFDLIEPQYHLAQIVVTNTPAQQAGNMQNNKASGDADPRKKIEALYSRLESGQDFASVAAQFSEDPNTASMGGDMGFARESQLKTDPAVYDAIGKLKPDQFTDPLPIYDSGTRAQDRRLRNLQADCARSRRAAGFERSARAAGYPPIASRERQATAAKCVP